MNGFERGAFNHSGFSLGLSLLLFFCPCLFSQDEEKKEASAERQSTFSIKVDSVVIRATVTDKQGNPVSDLTERDFRIYDDGKLQEIQTFALESPDIPVSEKDVPDALSPSESGITPIARPPRLISIVIDDLTMGSPNQPGSVLDYPRMIDAVKKFVKTDIGPADQVTILSGSRNVEFPFTDNRQRLLEELDSIINKLNTNWAFRIERWIDNEYRTVHTTMDDYDAWMWANDVNLEDAVTIGNSKENEFTRIQALVQYDDVQSRTRNLLYTIRQHLRALRHFEGTKMVVLFSDGFVSQIGRLTGDAEAHQLQELVNLALHNGIILNTVSTRGISSEIFMTGKVGIGSKDTIDRMMQEQPMEQLAFETGGEFFPRSNDMYIGLKSIAHSRHSHYVLTYAMPPHKPDGAYHDIRLEVARPGLRLKHRKGYYAPKEELIFENRKKEDLLDALSAPGNMNEIPVTLGYNYFQEDDSTYSVSFVTNVDIRELRFPDEYDRRKNQVSLILVAFDETDRYISGLEKSIDFQLLNSSYASLRERGLTSRVELKLLPGIYKVKAVVREDYQGKIGSVTKSVEIP